MNTPPVCITMRLPVASHYFAAVLGTGSLKHTHEGIDEVTWGKESGPWVARFAQIDSQIRASRLIHASAREGGRTLRKDVFLPSKHLLSAFYKMLPFKNPSKNPCLYQKPLQVPSKNPSKKHLLLENLLRTLLRSVRLHDPLGVHPIHANRLRVPELNPFFLRIASRAAKELPQVWGGSRESLEHYELFFLIRANRFRRIAPIRVANRRAI